jgi:hypothetical protein
MGSHVWLPPRLCQHGGARGLTRRILPVQKPAIFSGLNNKKMFIFLRQMHRLQQVAGTS